MTLVGGIFVTTAPKESEPIVDLLLGVALAASTSELRGWKESVWVFGLNQDVLGFS